MKTIEVGVDLGQSIAAIDGRRHLDLITDFSNGFNRVVAQRRHVFDHQHAGDLLRTESGDDEGHEETASVVDADFCGMRIRNEQPMPCDPSASTTVPPCRSTIALTIASPSPTPSPRAAAKPR